MAKKFSFAGQLAKELHVLTEHEEHVFAYQQLIKRQVRPLNMFRKI